MTTIIVGVDDSDRSIDAIAFARGLASAARARLVLATAYPLDGLPSQAVYPELDSRLRGGAEDILARMRLEAPDVETEARAIADSSPARALHALAEREKATLIVIGSSHRGNIGRVLAGTTAERLMHGSPCPVAVVPRRHSEQAGEIRSILVAYDGSAEAKAALHAAMMAGRALSAAVHVVRVLEPSSIAALNMTAATGYVVPLEAIEREAREAFETDIATLPNHERLLAELVVGDPAEELADRSQSADLLVTGSRGHGAMRAVLLGSVSGHLVREAACPVIVVPRGVESHFEQLFRTPPGDAAVRTAGPAGGSDAPKLYR